MHHFNGGLQPTMTAAAATAANLTTDTDTAASHKHRNNGSHAHHNQQQQRQQLALAASLFNFTYQQQQQQQQRLIDASMNASLAANFSPLTLDLLAASRRSQLPDLSSSPMLQFSPTASIEHRNSSDIDDDNDVQHYINDHDDDTHFNFPKQPLDNNNGPNDEQCHEGAQQAAAVRINYCTICNKELCNKYFMRTHMMKMHGIKLEVEPSATANEADEPQIGGELERQVKCESNSNDDDNDDDSDDDDDEGRRQNANSNDEATDFSMKEATPSLNQTSNQNYLKDDASATKQSQAKGKKQQQQPRAATSVANGFAGNSMGGVKCDICKKELCSKYFLRVHKQNTHGISTSSMGVATAASLGSPADVAALGNFGAGAAGLMAPLFANFGGQPAAVASGNFERTAPVGVEDFNAHSQQPPASKRQKGADGKHKQPNADKSVELNPKLRAAFDPIAAADAMLGGGVGPDSHNPLAAALMPQVQPVTADVIVSLILRNQHAYNKQQQQIQASKQQQQQQETCGDSPKIAGATEQTTAANAAGLKYTEVCQMCERRFKSIKWLTTHMRNDHKAEISAYMRAMMQHIYAARSQQLAMAVMQMDGQVGQAAIAMATAAAAAAAAASMRGVPSGGGGDDDNKLRKQRPTTSLS